ncbi:hypothetical protein DMB95_08130 [Campylobacter sp. MIT 12-8780]|uniref:LptF/LptG family permease n=1 Tax=unclassified Campylobacter TaxID=2593542 RepID=UPI00115E17A0|nr:MULTISPECIES: LptF/LptG family permease [unclassified Campylobacter]NDJ27289.1 LptF/LptG family permease [Campylobacter sp. MIT 19-121]TQR40382.1 hypothetical protein DMB95_08130 [Campylobacter sp. MIT 12-8780]
MSIFFRFISGIYLKSFFIILIALTFFFVGIDLLLNFKDLPNSANLVFLYVLFLACTALSYIMPISLVFALIICLINMIRSNELVSFYALSLSRNLVILYPFLWAVFFCCVFIGLNFTPFAYANDYKSNILNNAVLSTQSSSIFVKYDDKFIYIESLEPLQNEVKNIKIFSIDKLNLSQIQQALKARFKDDIWLLENANKLTTPSELKLYGEGLKIENFNELETLEGFKPKIIESVASKSNYTIIDAWQSFKAFQTQGVNTSRVKTELYKLIFAPLFAPFLMLILYQFFPIIGRFFNLAFISFIFFVVTLGTWGFLFLLTRLSEGGVISAEIGIIAPVLSLAFVSFFILYKKKF